MQGVCTTLLLKQSIEAERYVLSVPEEWDVTRLAGDGLSFQLAGQPIGTLRGRLYYQGLTLSDLVPRGAQIVSLRLVDEVPEGFELQVQFEPNETCGEQAPVLQTHFYYLMPAQRVALDLHLHIEQVGRHVAVAVAKSLMPKGTADTRDRMEKRHR